MVTDLEMKMGTARNRPSFLGGKLDLRLCDCHMASILHHFKPLRPCETGLFLSPVQVESSRIPFCVWLVHKCMKQTRDAQNMQLLPTLRHERLQRERGHFWKTIFFRCSYNQNVEIMSFTDRIKDDLQRRQTQVSYLSSKILSVKHNVHAFISDLTRHIKIMLVFILYLSVFFGENIDFGWCYILLETISTESGFTQF